jgi:hypothetical protein
LYSLRSSSRSEEPILFFVYVPVSGLIPVTWFSVFYIRVALVGM